MFLCVYVLVVTYINMFHIIDYFIIIYTANSQQARLNSTSKKNQNLIFTLVVFIIWTFISQHLNFSHILNACSNTYLNNYTGALYHTQKASLLLEYNHPTNSARTQSQLCSKLYFCFIHFSYTCLYTIFLKETSTRVSCVKIVVERVSIRPPYLLSMIYFI